MLVRANGHVSKEALVREVWGQKGYHPLRDDKRLQVAIHRLRMLVEPEPRAPRWILRDGDGYRLGAPVELGALG